ncbi:RteC domain-containing protein [Chryseobacterium sp. cx-311]|uniref:RteC domain-containing protein n=1 Tax=Marnyiella aurantia TaxID=2758037 RepID=UPI001AE73EFE|nr:RteC domain-containing protein [Marnyiella aurantia]MBP0612477.1 RteC domain-containing protein [Marnyiella aurantia]
MKSELLNRRAKDRYGIMRQIIENIEAEDLSNIERFEKIVMETDLALRDLKAWVSVFEFDSVAEEVIFFKEIKPMFSAEFMFRSKILELEVSKPNAGQMILKSYYESELQTLKGFVDEYSDFYSYYRRSATYLDNQYFVRGAVDLKMTTDGNMHNFDERFTTPADPLVARIVANDRLEQYLLRNIYQLEGYYYEKFTEKSPLTWTGSKSALVELLYALHLTHSFNGGSTELSEAVKVFEKTFNMDLGNFYKTLNEVKNRKTGRTKFLQSLQERLEAHFEQELE